MPAPHHTVFCRPDALPAAQPTVKALKALTLTAHIVNILRETWQGAPTAISDVYNTWSCHNIIYVHDMIVILWV